MSSPSASDPAAPQGDVDAYDYELPAERIAQVPLEPRDASRLLHLRPDGGVEDRRFTELSQLLAPGDLVVANDTRVRAARLTGTRPGGAAAELLVLTQVQGNRYVCLVRPARRLPEGTVLTLGGGALQATVLGPAPGHDGARLVELATDGEDVEAVIEAAGTMPLPPYIRGPLEDRARYQTLHAATEPLSAAAPTAGLHFTPAVREQLTARGVAWATVTLEVGLGTFSPIRVDRLDDHRMHEERCRVPAATEAAVRAARDRGGRVVAVGTTVVRTLEARADGGGGVIAGEAVTDLFLRPGSAFQVVDGLVTNFHQPRSSLLVLLAAFVGEQAWRGAYAHALATGYRFLSFGDCMLCWRAS